MSAGADPHLVADDARGLGTPPGGWATRIDANTFALPPLRAHAMKRGTPPAAPARRRRRPQLDARNRGSRVGTFLCGVSEATLALPGGGAGEGVATYAYDPATGRLGVNLGFAYDGVPLTKSSFAGATSGSINWSYDGFLRAKQEDLGASHLYPVTYAYDADDLLVTVAAAGTSALTYSRYDEQDRLVSYDGTTYTYTAWGALASSKANGATTTYTYDALGALREVDLPVTADSSGGAWTYTNDALGRRIVRRAPDGTVTKLLYAGMRPAALLDANDAVVARYVYGRDRLAPELIVTAGTTYRVLCDHLGTPRLLVDAAGNVAEQSDYDASGVLVARTGRVSENIFGFAGGIVEDATGFVRFGARDYDPRSGRWTSKDPAGFGGGLNWYAYAGDDPLNFADPTGSALPPGYDAGPRAFTQWFHQQANLAYQWGADQWNFGNKPAAVALGLLGAFADLAPTAIDLVLAVGPMTCHTPGGPPSNATFIGQENGPSIIVPEGASGPLPVANGKGVQYVGGSGGPRLDPRVSGLRIMDPTPPRGPSPGYPGGYGSYSHQAGQTVNPASGQTVSPSDPVWHIPLDR